MSHGKVIKNRSFGAAALIKSVYDISLFVLVAASPRWGFPHLSAAFVSGSSLKRCQEHVLRGPSTAAIRLHVAPTAEPPPLRLTRLSSVLKRHLNGAKRRDGFLTRTGAIAASSFKRRERSIQTTIYLLCCHCPPPLLSSHQKKNAVYKIFSYSQGALSRLLEASALIA